MVHGRHGWRVADMKVMRDDNRKEDISKTRQSDRSALSFGINRTVFNKSRCRLVEFRIR